METSGNLRLAVAAGATMNLSSTQIDHRMPGSRMDSYTFKLSKKTTKEDNILLLE
jgi:hypothetical protein